MRITRTFLPLALLLSFWGLLLLLAPQELRAQEKDSMDIDAFKVRFFEDIGQLCDLGVTTHKNPSATELASLTYKPVSFIVIHKGIPQHFMEETVVLRFYLHNSSDKEEQIYFTPGYYLRNQRIFKADPSNIAGTIYQIPDSAIKSIVYPAAKLLKLAPGERAVFFSSFNFIRTNANNFSPCLVERDFIRYWEKTVKYRDPTIDISTYVISGILLLMIFYSLAVFIQTRAKEFLFYAIYAFCSTVLFFFKSYSLTESKEWNFVYEEYLDFIILSLGVFCYLYFVRWFINTKNYHPRLHRFLKIASWILVGLLVLFSGIYFMTDRYVILYSLENYVIKIFMFLIGVVFIVYSFGRKDKLLNYLAWGNGALIFFSILSLLLLVGIKFGPKFLNKGLLYYEIGVVTELIFFLSGLAYKNRRDLVERIQERERFKLENERKEFEKQIAIVTTRQEERDRISADMHDELGSGMTSIRLHSEILKTKMKDQAFPELEKISNSANDLLGKMNSIIWTMKSSNDTLESLVAYLRAHALEYFDNTAISCKVFVPDSIPSIEMSGEKRRNIFLAVKESLHNILKHSQASEVNIVMQIKEGTLIITVSDNGVGIDTEKLRRFGNGLSNMKRRMESIRGDFKAENRNGSLITFTIPL